MDAALLELRNDNLRSYIRNPDDSISVSRTMVSVGLLFTLCVFIFTCHSPVADCADVLAVFPAPGYSQFVLAERLVCALVERGHNVTLISAYKPKSCQDSVRHISVEGVIALTRGENSLYIICY